MFAAFFSRYLFQAIGGILISLMLWGFWHKFTHHYIQMGITQQKVETDKCKAAYTLLSIETQKQTDAVNKLAIAAKQAQKRRVEAIKKSAPIVSVAEQKKMALQASTQSVGASQGSCTEQLQDLQGLLDKAR